MAETHESVSSLGIPPSQYVVDVSVIDSTTHVEVPLGFFIRNPLTGHDTLNCPSYVFLIESHQGKRVLFDLGLRKDTVSFPPVIRSGMANLIMKTEKDVATILKDDGRLALADINSIIWRYDEKHELRSI